MESILLTHENRQIQLHARDGIQAVNIEQLILEGELTVADYPALSLVVRDESDLVLWTDQLLSYAQIDRPKEAVINRTFAVWGSLTIGINPADSESQRDFTIRLYYTLNP